MISSNERISPPFGDLFVLFHLYDYVYIILCDFEVAVLFLCVIVSTYCALFNGRSNLNEFIVTNDCFRLSVVFFLRYWREKTSPLIHNACVE